MSEESENEFGDEILDDGMDERPAEAVSYEPIALGGMEDAPEGTEAKLKGFPNPDIKESPVVPLGFFGSKVVFAMPEGELRSEQASKVGQMLRTDIFACAAGAAFMTYWRDAEDKFQREAAAIYFVRKCREAGLWDPARPVRGLGVWPGEAGALMLHRGGEVWKFQSGKKVERKSIADMMREKGAAIYQLKPAAPAPGKPSTIADGAKVRAWFDMWRFEAIGLDGLSGADVLAGWLMASLLGAVAPFRGHVIINAMAGSGKTTLVHFIHALLSALAGPVLDSFSEAGLRSDLSGNARPVLLDEAEASASAFGPGVVEQALALLRRMATGAGSTRKQGGGDGGTMTQTAVGAALMAAINPPKLTSQDGTRMVEVRLLSLGKGPPRPGPQVTDDDIEVARLEAEKLAPKLLGRAMLGARRYKADVAAIKAALRRAGQEPRAADLIAMVAAGRRLLLHDKPLDEAGADAEVAFWRPLISQREAAEVVTNPGADAFAHLMAAETSQYRSDRRLTIGIMVERLVAGERDYIEPLKGYGLQTWEDVGPDGRPGPWLIVSNHHPALEKIFAGTVWGNWRLSLSYLDELGDDHKTWATKPLRYGAGVKQRGLAIPLTPLLERFAGQSSGDRSTSVPPTVPGEAVDWEA